MWWWRLGVRSRFPAWFPNFQFKSTEYLHHSKLNKNNYTTMYKNNNVELLFTIVLRDRQHIHWFVMRSSAYIPSSLPRLLTCRNVHTTQTDSSPANRSTLGRQHTKCSTHHLHSLCTHTSTQIYTHMHITYIQWVINIFTHIHTPHTQEQSHTQTQSHKSMYTHMRNNNIC